MKNDQRQQPNLSIVCLIARNSLRIIVRERDIAVTRGYSARVWKVGSSVKTVAEPSV